MSSRARRVDPAGAAVSAFPWGGQAAPVDHRHPVSGDAHQAAYDAETFAMEHEAHLAALEREAFGKGYAQGEQAGAEAASQRGEAMLHRLTETLNELTHVRADMIRQTEKQMVHLALAIARRILQREVSLDPDLLLAMARVALERLGESARVTVRLHPEDYAAAGAARVTDFTTSTVTIVSDARLSRGACRVESDMGLLDVGIDAQLLEVGRALIGTDDPAQPVTTVRSTERAVHV
jgi:flagellar assembly protein FliH